VKPGDLVTIERPDIRFNPNQLAIVIRIYISSPARWSDDVPEIKVAEVLPVGWHERVTYIIKDLKVYKSA